MVQVGSVFKQFFPGHTKGGYQAKIDLRAAVVSGEAGAPFNDARAQLNDYLNRAATVGLPEDKIAIRDLADIVIYDGLVHTTTAKLRSPRTGPSRVWPAD
ncbi:MAG: hypothetical protein ACREFL_02800 [Stellaceae bacterium]